MTAERPPVLQLHCRTDMPLSCSSFTHSKSCGGLASTVAIFVVGTAAQTYSSGLLAVSPGCRTQA